MFVLVEEHNGVRHLLQKNLILSIHEIKKDTELPSNVKGAKTILRYKPANKYIEMFCKASIEEVSNVLTSEDDDVSSKAKENK